MRAHSPLSIALHTAAKMVVDSGYSRGAYVIYGCDRIYHPCMSMEFKGMMVAIIGMNASGKLAIVR